MTLKRYLGQECEEICITQRPRISSIDNKVGIYAAYGSHNVYILKDFSGKKEKKDMKQEEIR